MLQHPLVPLWIRWCINPVPYLFEGCNTLRRFFFNTLWSGKPSVQDFLTVFAPYVFYILTHTFLWGGEFKTQVFRGWEIAGRILLLQGRFSSVTNIQPPRLTCSGAFRIHLPEISKIRRTKSSRKFVWHFMRTQ